MPDEVSGEEVVRLDATVEKECVGKMDRTGTGALGVGSADDEHGLMIDEDEVEAVEALDVETVWEQGGRHSPMGLLVLVGLLGLVVLGVAMMLIPRGDRLVDEKAAELVAERLAEEQSMMEAGVLMEHIEGAVRSYLQAETVAEKLKYVRHPERVGPLMEDYYRERPLKPRSYQSVTAFYPVGLDNEAFLFMQVRETDGGLLPLLLEQVGDDAVQVDWETDVAYQPMPLADYLERRPTEAMDFRVFAKLDVFYAYEFADARQYQSLMLTERDSENYLFGYVERGSVAHEALMEILGKNPKRPEPVLLKLRFLPGSAAKRSVLIEEVVARRWALLRSGEEG